MVMRSTRRWRRIVGAGGPKKLRPDLEPLEHRLLLSGTSGDSTASDDLVEAYQAAFADFHGPDLVGKDGPMWRIGFDLTLLFEEYQIHQQRDPGAPFVAATGDSLQLSGDRLTVEFSSTAEDAALRAQLSAIGMEQIENYGSLYSGDIPIGSLNEFAALPSLVLARPGYQPITRAGSVQSQGDAALRADLARTSFGVDGTGLTIGILSDSFNTVAYAGNVDGVAQDIATGDLPADTQILDDIPSGSDEGRGMAQLVHDIAPGAAIQFATAFRSPASFANNIQLLANSGSDVIVDDVGWLTVPYFQDGVIAQSVDTVVAAGVPYFSSAGNSADESYESAFVASGVTGDGGREFHDFDPGAGVVTQQEWEVVVGGSMTLGFQWDQPFASLGGPGSTNDVDLSLIGADGTTVVASAVTNNVGGDPMEILRFVNDGSYNLDGDGSSDTSFFLRVELVSGAAPGLMKTINFGNGSSIAAFATNSSTDFGHPNSEGGLGVAASVYLATPSFGTDPPLLNDFSSKGGTPILFDVAGNRLAAPIDRMSPEVTGPDGANTTFFGSDIPQDADAFPNFFGTSAAAPHVAAVAALMLQSTGGPGSVSPQAIYDAMQSTAIDITSRVRVFGDQSTIPIDNGVGFDRFSGYGLVDAVAAIQFISSGITIDDVTLREGNDGVTEFVFTVGLTGSVGVPTTVAFSTADDTATAPDDYAATSGTLTFSPGGQASMSLTVEVVGDVEVETNETFFVNLAADGIRLIRSQGIGTIINDDVDLSINDVSIVEGNAGTKDVVFTVSSLGTVNETITVAYATLDGTARAPSDFLPRGGTLTINPVKTTATLTVPVVNDTFNEAGTEEFFVLLGNAVNARVADGIGTATIIDNDRRPSFYVNDALVSTMGPGVEVAMFTVALDHPSGREVTVHYTTVDGTAKAGESYAAMSGDLTFSPGVNTIQVTVPIMPSAVYEPNEQFFLDLSEPAAAEISDGRGVGTIVFADPPPMQYVVDDGDAEFSRTGAWTNVTNLTSYQLDYLYHAPGSGSATAAWSFDGISNGIYQILTRWSHFSNRATNAQYTVYDALGPLGNATVNQQVAPSGDVVGDVTWEILGSFEVVNRTLRVELNGAGNGYVVADAVRIVSGNAVPQAPEIDVAGFGQSIADGDTSPEINDGTDFGSTLVNTAAVTRTFTIQNTGNADLHLTGSTRVQITGAHVSDFAVTSEPDFTVPPGGTTTFDIAFSPSGLGLREATVSIGSDDSSEPLYDFAIHGSGTSVLPLAQNTAMPEDVNADTLVSPYDALLVINALIRNDAAANAEPSAAPLAAATSSTDAPPQYYVDVNGDGRVSPHDVLLVINHMIIANAAAAPSENSSDGGSAAPLAATDTAAEASPAMAAVAVDIALGDVDESVDADGQLALDVAAAGPTATGTEPRSNATLLALPSAFVEDSDDGDDEDQSDALLAVLDA